MILVTFKKLEFGNTNPLIWLQQYYFRKCYWKLDGHGHFLKVVYRTTMRYNVLTDHIVSRIAIIILVALYSNIGYFQKLGIW